MKRLVCSANNAGMEITVWGETVNLVDVMGLVGGGHAVVAWLLWIKSRYMLKLAMDFMVSAPGPGRYMEGRIHHVAGPDFRPDGVYLLFGDGRRFRVQYRRQDHGTDQYAVFSTGDTLCIQSMALPFSDGERVWLVVTSQGERRYKREVTKDFWIAARRSDLAFAKQQADREGAEAPV
jgi:hypothetical protein